MHEVTLIRKDIEELRSDINSLNDSVSGLVSAWQTASGVVRFVKWSAAVVAALTTIGVSMKVSWQIFVASIKSSL